MPFKTLTGLWKDDDKGYLSGKSKDPIEIPAGVKLFIFANDKRETDRHPTHRLAIAVDDEQGGPPSDPF